MDFHLGSLATAPQSQQNKVGELYAQETSFTRCKNHSIVTTEKVSTNRLCRNEVLSAANRTKENSGYSIQGSVCMAISMRKVWEHISGLSKRRQPQTNINACPRHGSHIVHLRIELWSHRTCFGQPERRHRKNESLSCSSICCRESAGMKQKNLLSGY
jgi:hypothetical protein